MRNAPILILFALLALGQLGNTGCPEEAAAPIDADVVVASTAAALAGAAEPLIAGQASYPSCIAGVVLKGTADYTNGVALPIKAAVAAGSHEWAIASVTIDPTPCVALLPEGAPAPASASDIWLYVNTGSAALAPMLDLGAQVAKAKGDTTGCAILSAVADTLTPAGLLGQAIEGIAKAPGTPFTSPASTGDLSACYE